MENLKLIDVGVFLFKRKTVIIAIALLCAIIMVMVTCVLGPVNEAIFSMRITANSALDSFTSQYTEDSTIIISDAEYPFDDSVSAYIESVKRTKSASGRKNPYSNNIRLDVSSLQNYLLEEKYSQFLKTKGIDALVNVKINTADVTITLEYNDKRHEEQFRNEMLDYTAEYLSGVTNEYINEIFETHSKLLAEDEKAIQSILSEYNKTKTDAVSDPLSSEKCRSLLNSYAQAAYNYDISNSVVLLSEQLLALGTQPTIELVDEDFQNNISVGKIAVFSVFGLVIGIIFACFIVYIASLCSQIWKKVRNYTEPKDTESK